MQIGKILFPVTALGPGRRVGVWTQGCNKNCAGCSNPELKAFDESKEIAVDTLTTLVTAFDCDGVTITGGEPFLQTKELNEFVRRLNGRGIADILVYSGYTYEELAARRDADTDAVLANIAALVDGPFVRELADDVPLRGSSNQKVRVFRSAFAEAYARCVAEEKRVDVFSFGKETHFIGIPVAGYETVYSDYVKYKTDKKGG